MALRKVLVGILAFLMVSPVWGGGEPAGSIISSSNATVRDSALTPGLTVFIGDAISVAARGGTRISLTGGAQAEVLGNSSVRLTKDGDKIQMVVDRGQASFHTSGRTQMSALVADATVRPASGAETSAIIQSLSETHAVIAAEKGVLLVTTAHDGKVYTVGEGQAVDLSAMDDPQQGGGAVPAGKAAPRLTLSKKHVIWIVALVGGGVAVTAYLLSRNETKLSTTTLQNEISPHKLN